MPTTIPNINQTISTVQPVLHRDTINPTIPATQDAFVQSAEAFFDKISDTTVNEVNQVTTKIDATVSAINIVSNEISTAAIEVEDAKQITIDAKEATIIAKNEAQSIYDNFDDRYLGTKSTPPTVDNDGDPLKQGALYCQESINPEENGLMYVYDILLGDWVNITFVPTLLSSLTDVFFSGLANGDILKYDISIGKWKNIPADYYAKTETYAKTEINSKLSQLFIKPKSRSRLPLFIKQTPYSIYIPSGTKIEVSNSILEINSNITISLNSNLLTPEVKTAGTDYYVYAKSDATFYISASDAITADRLIGGFHYGLVGEAETVTGNKTEAMMVEQRGIWSHSCWDLKFRPSSSVRGKNFAHGIWVDIYLADEDIAIRGYSSPWKSAGVKAKIAGGTTDYGRAIPKIPLAFGGNGTLTYGKFTWFQATEIAASLKCFLLDYNKFPSLAYGVLEGVSSSTNSYETTAGAIEHYPNLTSRYMEQAAGVQWIWGADLANYPTDTVWAWKANTDGRGQIYSTDNSPTAVILGGSRGDGAYAGSRASYWNIYVWNSDWNIGCRFACDHLELV